MSQSISLVALLVADDDAAIAFYTQALRFTLVEDTPQGDGKRWVVIAPPGAPGVPVATGSRLLLAQAANARQQAQVGDRAGGRVGFFLTTDDFWADYHHMQAHGVVFADAPRAETYGTVVVFTDLYGNRWDLIQPQSIRHGAGASEN